MTLADAQERAEKIKAVLAPHCHRIEIGGSIRRKTAECGDIEIVCIPKADYGFIAAVRRWPKIKGEPTGKYTQRRVNGEKADIFMCRAETWGCIYAIRTGSASFSYALMIWAIERHMRFQNGRLLDRGDPIETPEEADVFRTLGLEWVEPEKRFGPGDLRKAKR